MIFHAIFKNEGRALVRVSDGAPVPTIGLPLLDAKDIAALSVPPPQPVPLAVARVPWSAVETDAGEYDESYLASLRDFLKSMEESGSSAIILADDEGNAQGERAGAFIDAAAHCARRVKDCASVAGFALPDSIAKSESLASKFIESLRAKHPHYVFFASQNIQDERLIPYSLR